MPELDLEIQGQCFRKNHSMTLGAQLMEDWQFQECHSA